MGRLLHVYHNEDEIFRIIKGGFRLRVGAETSDAGPGDMGRIAELAARYGLEFLGPIRSSIAEPRSVPSQAPISEPARRPGGRADAGEIRRARPVGLEREPGFEAVVRSPIYRS